MELIKEIVIFVIGILLGGAGAFIYFTVTKK